MSQLVNLAEYKQKLQRDLQNANLSDCLLPSSFKTVFRLYRSYNFEYYKYTVKVSTAQGDCYVPNQWIYIGALCSQYYSELTKYKSKLTDFGITEDQLRRCHPGRDDNDIPANQRSLEHVKALATDYLQAYDGDDKELLISFLYDYNSWGGGKNISRNDFTVSPVLSIANSINASSGLIGVIAEALGEMSDVRQKLVESTEWGLIMHPKNSVKKQELIREKAAAKFVRLALKETIKEDKELSLLMQSPNISISAKRLNVGRFCIGCDCTQLPPRADDYDSEIVWNYNAKSYYLYLEWTPADVEAKFIPEYNNAYKSKFYICKEGGDFVLYQIEQDEDYCRQQIYYGCPGSGKSHYVNFITENVDSNFVFRTTFHPDTDYASFVGCYKPHTQALGDLTKQLVLDYNGLVEKFKEYIEVKPTNITKACTLFGYDYYESIVKMQEDNVHTIPMLVAEAYKDGSTYDSQVRAGMSVYETSTPVKSSEKSIVYKFCPQVFTKAYVQAWQNLDRPVYLIIEEINRGNCAQIFGDLFQLLDRCDDGFSEYPIKADKDLADYLKDVLGVDHDGIKDGELRLPSNLIIYATMNTSDQSLFPMDSAFKRRWDWEYVPIEYGADKKSYNFIITIGDKEYRWVEFLKIVNEKIYDATNSEDKQMGNFFIKKSIDAATFVNKVMFYLWNEVCKEEYGTQRNFFRKGKEGKDEFKFTELFGSNRDTILNEFMSSLNVPTLNKEPEKTEA